MECRRCKSEDESLRQKDRKTVSFLELFNVIFAKKTDAADRQRPSSLEVGVHAGSVKRSEKGNYENTQLYRWPPE